MESLPLTLYRVGEPSIGETWPRRFRSGRSTGGLGTGIYAFRDEWAAKRNEGAEWTNEGLYELRDALSSPIQPRTLDATDALVKLSRAMSLLAEQVHADKITFDDVIDPDPIAPEIDIEGVSPSTPTPMFTLTGGLGGSPGVNTEKARTAFTTPAREVLYNTPALRDRYGYDTDEFVADFFRATREAYQEVTAGGGFWNVGGTQPINHLLYPNYDGVAPLDGAGGNTGQHGCVVFKEKVDACVGHDTDTFEQVDPERLNRCWANG